MSKFYDPKEIEKEILNEWITKKIPQRIVENSFKKFKRKFYLLDGPPYVNQIPHVGHIKTTTMKDIWSKFKLLQGFASWFQPGFDCHGLPIENMVEKKLGIKSKKEIEKMGVDKFIQLCREHAEGNEKRWLEIYKMLGAWRGFFEPYMTLHNYYIESAWWTFKQFFEKGMVYEGLKPTYWCPHCQTALAGYEVTDSYANVKDPYIYVKFPIEGKKDEYIVIFTTTPWTLVGNVAIAVHPDETYVKVRVNNEILIIAEKRVEAVLKDLCGIENYKIVEKLKGKDLENVKYKPVLDVPIQRKLEEKEKAHRIVLSIPVLKSKAYSKAVAKGKEDIGKEEVEDFVNVEEGSGAVHTAPGHGPEDYYVGVHYNLPIVSPVDEEGKFTEEAGKYAGIFVKDAEREIIEDLKKKDFLLYEGYIVHPYPLCWRCKSRLIFRLSKQWFFSIDPIKKKMLEENRKVKWFPEFGRVRFENWVKQSTDWCISRQRYWGIPIPIWRCENGHTLVIGSVKELKEHSIEKLPEELDLHKNVVDGIKLKCPECGKEMKRIPDILDVWFDSGIAPWASLGYPFKNKELFEKLWPVDMVCESQDQIRGWFYSLMFCGVGVFGRSPYRGVSMMGWVVDEKGEKMSKSKGNVVWATEGLEKYGADLLRLYYCWGRPPWEIQFFSERTLKEVKKHLNILWNVHNFYQTFKPENFEPKLENLEIEDRWILSRLNSLIKDATEWMENFEFHKVGRKIMEFIAEDVSRVYVKLIRERADLYAEEKTRNACLSVLHEILLTTIKLLAPITPFISEKIYKEIKGKLSVFEEEWPAPDESHIDKNLEEKFEKSLKIVECILRAREKAKIKLRWPLQEIYLNNIEKNVIEEKVIKLLGNVKEVKFGKQDKWIKETVENAEVYVPKELNEEMKKEAIVREIIRRVQETRKKFGFNIKEKIGLYLTGVEDLIENFAEKIRKEVNAEYLIAGELKGEFGGSFEVFGRKVEFKFKKI